MIQNQTKNQLVEKIREEFESHAARRPAAPFQMSAALARETGALAREMERKRQAGTLTDSEESLLARLSEWDGRIALYNSELKKTAAGKVYGENIYDMMNQRISEETDGPKPVAIPRISAVQAERIIKGLNDQFEKKVLNRLKPGHAGPQTVQESASRTIADAAAKRQDDDFFDSSIGPAPAGRSLQDFLTAVRDERPAVPLADTDSQIDLSKLSR